MNQRRSTSLLLIALTLVTGVALGWLIRDLGSARSASAPTSVVVLPTAEPVATPEPTLAPTIAPRATPQPTVESTPKPTAIPTTEPTATPEPTAEPTATPAPTTPAETAISGYVVHVVADGETLESIAMASGSDAATIAQYNRLEEAPHTGRALIVPLGSGKTLDNPPTLIRRGVTDRPRIALTLDAGGGSEPVASMLQTLRERHITITFFLTGKWIRENPDLTRQIVADGHEIANHTLNHLDLTKVDDSTIRTELAETERLLHETAGADVSIRPFFRPPYGAENDHVLEITQGEGYLPIYWTLDSLDMVGEPKSADFLFERLTSKLPPEKLAGAILLAHCGNASTAEALPRVLDRFAEMGFEVTKLSRVLP